MRSIYLGNKKLPVEIFCHSPRTSVMDTSLGRVSQSQESRHAIRPDEWRDVTPVTVSRQPFTLTFGRTSEAHPQVL